MYQYSLKTVLRKFLLILYANSNQEISHDSHNQSPRKKAKNGFFDMIYTILSFALYNSSTIPDIIQMFVKVSVELVLHSHVLISILDIFCQSSHSTFPFTHKKVTKTFRGTFQLILRLCFLLFNNFLPSC